MRVRLPFGMLRDFVLQHQHRDNRELVILEGDIEIRYALGKDIWSHWTDAPWKTVRFAKGGEGLLEPSKMPFVPMRPENVAIWFGEPDAKS